MRALRSAVVVCMLWLVCSCAWASSSSSAESTQEQERGPAHVANAGDEPVGAGDLVYLSVTGADDLSHAYRVSKDGKIALPMVETGIAVSGMRPTEIARAVTDALVAQKVLVAPIVSAQVVEYRSRRVTVAGAVKTPVIVEATGNLKLLDAITRAHGFAPDAGPEIVVSHVADGSGTTRVVRVPIEDLLADKDSELNLPLRGGEEIRVPEAPKLYIAGNVKAPGIYPMNELGGLSVLKALALSQGTLAYSMKQAYVYRLVPGSTQRQEIEVPLRDILKRKTPDVQLVANDVLYIPENSRSRLSAAVLDRIVGFATSAPGLPVRR